MTSNADAFALHDLPGQFHSAKLQRGEPHLLLVATDGELYGHHQPFRDMFLAHLLKTAGPQSGIAPTFPARWLREHPPQRTIGIRERTSWSCHHGVARWCADCDCTPTGSPWKANLRNALDTLAVEIDRAYAEVLRPFAIDPWALRDSYIHVLLGEMPIAELIGDAAGRQMPQPAVHRIHKLLEAQRERQRMFTSCGWFFEDFDRIEPKNNVAYAAQAVHLMRLASGIDLAPLAAEHLRRVVSPRSGLSADQVFARHLQRAQKNV